MGRVITEAVTDFEYGCRHHGTGYLMVAGVAHYVSAVIANGHNEEDDLRFVEVDHDYTEHKPGYVYCVAPIGGGDTGMPGDSCGARIATWSVELGWTVNANVGRVK